MHTIIAEGSGVCLAWKSCSGVSNESLPPPPISLRVTLKDNCNNPLLMAYEETRNQNHLCLFLYHGLP